MDTPHVVKQGWLRKRAVYLKSWRDRYFILKSDGQLIGLTEEPSEERFLERPRNKFNVKNCEVLPIDLPFQVYAFYISGLHSSKVDATRVFSTPSRIERASWIKAVTEVKHKLSGNPADLEDEDDEVLSPSPFQHREVYQKASGKYKLTFDNFEFLKVIGRGTFAKVVLCRKRDTGKLYAMKVMKKAAILASTKDVDHIKAEVSVLMKVSHPFLLKLKYSFKTEERLCLVTEYVNGGELLYHMKNEPDCFPEDRVRFYAAEITCALAYLHGRGIIHRDLKLENLLLDKDGHIKIADFGLCKEMVNDEGHVMTNSFCGTPGYLAPEVIQDPAYGFAVDWWQLGVVAFEMATKRPPFQVGDGDNEQTITRILCKDVKFPACVELSACTKSFLRDLLIKDPSIRLGANGGDEVKEHAFFRCICWSDLEYKKVKPPFKPEVANDVDTRNFDIEFTGENVEFTPTDNHDLDTFDEEAHEGFELIPEEAVVESFVDVSLGANNNNVAVASAGS